MRLRDPNDPDGNGEAGTWLSEGDSKFQLWSQEEDSIQLVCSYVPLFVPLSLDARKQILQPPRSPVRHLSTQ
jgi:hypothetical protein